MNAPRRVPGHALFFPAAAAYAALILPVSIAALLGMAPAPPGLASPFAHAHEMLFGFALAAVAGNQLGPTPAPRLYALFAAWLLARAAFLGAPGTLASAAANAAFAALLALALAPRLLGRAKKLRNRALPVMLVALCAAAVALEAGLAAASPPLQQGALVVAVLLLSLLMLFMGGRIIAPAAAGQLHQQGDALAHRVQPRIEGALIVLMLLAAAAAALGRYPWAGLCCMAAGALAALRMARWRLPALRGRPDLLCLGAGYAWLAAGLVATGYALAAGQRIATPLHLITVGSIGTLTINVMALTWLRLARRDPARARIPVYATALIAVAAVSRVFSGAGPAALMLAAGCWAAAYLLLLLLFARTRRAA